MRKLNISLIAILTVLTTAQAYAAPMSMRSQYLVTLIQQKGGRHGVFMQGGPMNELMLLRRSDVRADLKLTDSQQTKLKDAQTGLRQSFQSGDRKGAFKTYQTALESILTPDQKNRLHQISIQLDGPLAVLMPDVSKALKLTPEQKEKIKELQAKEVLANENLFKKMRSGLMDRQAGMDALKKNRDILKKVIEGILTDDQKTKLTELGGKKFKATDSKSGFNGGRPGG